MIPGLGQRYFISSVPWSSKTSRCCSVSTRKTIWFEGTRVPFDVVAELIYDGRIKPDEVASYYPGVSAAAASDALDFALSIPNWEEARASA